MSDQNMKISDSENLSENEKTELIVKVDADESLILPTNDEKLKLEESNLINQIIEAPTKEDLDKQFELFNINQSKKSALRIVKLNNLLAKVEDQAIARFEKRPDQISNKELLDYINIVSTQIDKAQSNVDKVTAKQAINLTATKNEVNINVAPQLDRDSKEKVIDIVSALLAQASEKNIEDNNVAIESDFTEVDDT